MPKKAPRGEFAKAQQGTTAIAGYDDKLVVPDDNVLRQKGGDLKIYADLLRDDQVSSTFQQRRDAVISTEWIVEPGGDSPIDKLAADHAREQLERISWDSLTDKALYGLFYGYNVAELLWQRQGNRIGWEKIKVRERGRFAFGESGQLYLKPKAGAQWQLMPDRKFWTFNVGADHDDQPYGLGLANKLYWPVFFKRNDIKFWLVFLERYASPTGIAKMPAGQFQNMNMRKDVMEALKAMAAEGQIVVPEGTNLEFLQSIYSGTADYESMKSAMDAAIAKIVLSQTMTTDNGSSRSQSETHKDVRDEVIKSDADLVCESFNRGPMVWLTEANFPDAMSPRVWRNTEPPEDLNERAKRDSEIIKLGYEPTEDYIKEVYGEGWVKKKAQPIRLPGSATGSPFGEDDDPVFAELSDLVATRNAHRADQQALVEAANRFAKRYSDTIGQEVQKLLEFLEQSEDVETFERHLADLVGQAPPRKAVENLERSGVVARLMGRLRGGR